MMIYTILHITAASIRNFGESLHGVFFGMTSLALDLAPVLGPIAREHQKSPYIRAN